MEREKINKILKEIPPAPNGVLTWILDYCVKNTYIIYSAPQNKAACTRCGEEMSLDKIGPNIKHNKPTVCPHCKRAATFKSEKIGRRQIAECFRVMILTRKGKSIYVTISEVVAKFETMGKPTIGREIRQVLKLGAAERANLFYHLPWWYDCEGKWEERKKMTVYRPIPGNFYAVSKFETLHLYDNNIKYSFFEKTDLRYAMIPDLLESWELTSEELVSYMDMILKYPSVELLIKFGIKVPILNYIDGLPNKNAIYWKGKTIQKMLRCTMLEARAVREEESNLETLRVWQDYRKKGTSVSIQGAELITRSYPAKNGKIPNVVKIANYLVKQNERYKKHNELADYEDYRRDCETIGYDWRRKRNRFPINFYKTHMEVSKKVKERSKEIEREAMEMVVSGATWIRYEEGTLFARIASDAEEIRNEGRQQCHCVAGYANQMAKGRCLIAFIRKKDDPEKSFYTVELSLELTVTQCRGFKNCNATSDVKEFIERWIKHVQKEWKKRKRKKPIQEKKSA